MARKARIELEQRIDKSRLQKHNLAETLVRWIEQRAIELPTTRAESVNPIRDHVARTEQKRANAIMFCCQEGAVNLLTV
ncbi:hypothetical protein KEJ15_01990 [Candidatus Bathyarchaeota archaeon]|nr:hypothetical protein [Candidatus Bathyarchaeota archaeon]